MNTVKSQKKIKKQKQEMTNTAMLVNVQFDISNMQVEEDDVQSEWGYWLSHRASVQPDRRASSLLTTACCKQLENDAPKKQRVKQKWTENKWNKKSENQ